jgi:predicted N-acetyltransferase YhbS
MNLRPATSADVAAIRAVAKRAYIKYVPRIGRVPAPMAADFLAHVQAGQADVAELDGVVMGYLIAFPRDEDYFVENVAVDPAGAGKGMGKTLMALAEDHARQAGLGKVVLYTNHRMHENFPFYAALGYRTTGLVIEAGFRRVYFEKDLVADER